MHLTDRLCIKQLKAGNSAGFDSLYLRYKKQLYTFVYALVLNHEDAEDIVSGVFQKLWEKHDTYRGSGSVKSWLFRIARNEAFSFLRKAPKRFQPFENSEDQHQDELMLTQTAANFENPRDLCEAKELVSIIKFAIRSLPRKQRCVYFLRWRDELTYCEIAERLSIPIGTVKSRMDKAAKRLSERLRPYCECWRDLQCKRIKTGRRSSVA